MWPKPERQPSLFFPSSFPYILSELHYLFLERQEKFERGFILISDQLLNLYGEEVFLFLDIPGGELTFSGKYLVANNNVLWLR